MIPRSRVPAHPGIILRREYLEPLEMTVTAMARHLQIEPRDLQALVAGEINVGPELAWRLAGALDTTPEFWLQLQAHHDLAAHRPEGEIPKLVALG